MLDAWEAIKAHPRVTVTVDLFDLGLVFFRKENKAKEHFRVIETRWKPFHIF